jgi:hypothetical protein
VDLSQVYFVGSFFHLTTKKYILHQTH